MAPVGGDGSVCAAASAGQLTADGISGGFCPVTVPFLIASRDALASAAGQKSPAAGSR